MAAEEIQCISTRGHESTKRDPSLDPLPRADYF
jgi:hypothetical protein